MADGSGSDVDLLDTAGILELVEILGVAAYQDLAGQFFESHGATVDGLRAALIARGHKFAIIALPYKWYPRSQIISSALAWRSIGSPTASR